MFWSPVTASSRNGDTFPTPCCMRQSAKAGCSMPPSEGVLLLLRKAAEDEALRDEVLESRRVSDAIFSCHAQQAVEKLLKAVLAEAGVHYPLTQRLAQLIDLM